MTGSLCEKQPKRTQSGDYQPAPFTDPPYDYAMNPAADVPSLVTRCAGPR